MTAIPGTIKKLQIPQYRTCGQRTFKYRATKIWNALDEQLKSINSINLFKSIKLKLEFLTKKNYVRHFSNNYSKQHIQFSPPIQFVNNF